MDPFDNPFSPGAGTSPPAFVGRDDLVADYKVALRRTVSERPGKSIMPIGLRGVGKTVLLNRFDQMAQEEGLVSAFIEAPETGDFEHLLAARLRSVLLELDRGSVSSAVKRALGTLKSFSYNLPDGTSIALNVDALAGSADSGVLAEDTTDLLVAAGEAAKDRGRGFLIAIDEVQYLSADELAALITAIHRTVQLGLPVILVGAGLPQLPGLAGNAKSYAERLFDFPEIGSLDDDDARSVLATPASAHQVEFSPDALDSLLGFTQGYPYFLQEWGYHVWNTAPESPITLDDVNLAARDVQRRLDENFFRVRMDRLTPAEKKYLAAMAELGPGPHRSGDIAAELGVKVESVAPRRSGLIQKGMVYSPAHGDTAFTVPMFDDFLRRTRQDY
ncbi:MAG TPA: AAA family ATPase [Solirubrobacterales bacterium]|nr:AAA family ATPase [Solirubrobacterales bacterium]